MSKVFIIETQKEVFWCNRKMDRDYKHATEFLYRDKARAKELEKAQFDRLRRNSSKKFWEIVEEMP